MDLPSISVSTHLNGPHQVRAHLLSGGAVSIKFGDPGEYQGATVFCPSLDVACKLLENAIAQCITLQNVTDLPSPVV